MFLKEIEIENFRGIKNLKIEDFGQINIFTGENNSGKTTILEAICLLVGNKAPSDTLLTINGYRQQNYILDANHNFYNDSNKINIFGQFNNNYSREVQIEKTKDDDGNRKEQILVSTITENDNSKEEIFPFVKRLWPPVNPNPNDAIYEMQIKYPKNKLKGIFPSNYYYEHLEYRFALIELLKNKDTKKIIEILNSIDKKINDIQIIGDSIYLGIENLSQLLPIELSGDGLRKILSIILALNRVKDGGLSMVDEIENGLHFSAMKKFWKALINSVADLNVQLFITTHNEELLEIFAQTLDEEKYQNFQNKIRYFNLKKYKNDEIVAYKYDFEKLDYLLSNGNEIR